MAVVLIKKPELKIESTERQFKNSVDAFCLKHNDVIPLEFDINIQGEILNHVMWLSLHVELIYVEWPMKGGPCKYKVINSAVLFELKKKQLKTI